MPHYPFNFRSLYEDPFQVLSKVFSQGFAHETKYTAVIFSLLCVGIYTYTYKGKRVCEVLVDFKIK